MAWLLLLGIAATGALVYANERGKVTVFEGRPVKFVFKSGSSPQNESRLRVLFTNVTDNGGGVYTVVPDTTGSIIIPEGTSVTVAGDTVTLS